MPPDQQRHSFRHPHAYYFLWFVNEPVPDFETWASQRGITPGQPPPLHGRNEMSSSPATGPAAGTAVRPAWADDKLFPFQSRLLTIHGHIVGTAAGPAVNSQPQSQHRWQPETRRPNPGTPAVRGPCTTNPPVSSHQRRRTRRASTLATCGRGGGTRPGRAPSPRRTASPSTTQRSRCSQRHGPHRIALRSGRTPAEDSAGRSHEPALQR